MNKGILLGFGLFLLTGSLAAADELQVSESQLVQFAREANQVKASAELVRQQAALAKSKFDETFETVLSSSASRANSKQASLSPFAPVMGPVDHYDLKVAKYLGRGVQVSTGLFADQMSTKDKKVDRSTETGVRAELKVDLWKNIFGKLDRHRIASNDRSVEAAAIKTAIDQRGFELDVRKAYWALVANNESINIAKDLVKQARKQLKESKKRQRSAIADKAETHRFLALLANRKSQLTSFEFQRQQITMQLKSMLPPLQGKTLRASKYNIGETIKSVLICTIRIKSNTEIPWENTRLDELIDIYSRQRQTKDQLANATSSADVNFFTQYELGGSGYKYSNSAEEFQKDPKPAYSFGLMISKPIGGQKSASSRIEKIVAASEFEMQKHQLKSRVHARHEEMLPMIDLLQSTVSAQNEYSKNLQIVQKETLKKFNQARVSVDSLIQIENDLLSSKIQLIQSELAVISELLSYFAVFTETPCSMNRI